MSLKEQIAAMMVDHGILMDGAQDRVWSEWANRDGTFDGEWEPMPATIRDARDWLGY